MQRKPKILFVTESSFLATGYGTYTKELLSRLHATGKYELAEYACYANQNDARQTQLPWKFYGNEPAKNQDGSPINKEEQDQFDSNPVNQLGKFRFEGVCLDFKPDIVADFRDEWYFNYQSISPFRPFYHWVIQPTVDGGPQKESWLETFSRADAILTYQDWSYELLKKSDPNGKLNLRGVASPGVDYTTFSPLKRSDVRSFWGLPEDAFIVGMASRSQPRKLYPELLRAYAKYLYSLSPHEQSKNFLHLHTFYPDLCWDIPRYIKQHGLSHKTLFTYICYKCGYATIKFFVDSRGVCPKCGDFSLMMPNTRKGLTREQLANVYQSWNLAVQFSNSEGLGITQIESAACGIPVASVDYSGMADVISKLGGYKINVLSLLTDYQNGDCLRAVPDEDSLVAAIKKVRELPNDYYEKKSGQFRELAKKYYNWDVCAKKWMEVFDSFELRPERSTWRSAPRIFKPQTQAPQQVLNNPLLLVNFCILHVAGMPQLLGTLFEQTLVHDLISAKTTPQAVIKMFLDICEFNNRWEEIRYENLVCGSI